MQTDRTLHCSPLDKYMAEIFRLPEVVSAEARRCNIREQRYERSKYRASSREVY